VLLVECSESSPSQLVALAFACILDSSTFTLVRTLIEVLGTGFGGIGFVFFGAWTLFPESDGLSRKRIGREGLWVVAPLASRASYYASAWKMVCRRRKQQMHLTILLNNVNEPELMVVSISTALSSSVQWSLWIYLWLGTPLRLADRDMSTRSLGYLPQILDVHYNSKCYCTSTPPNWNVYIRQSYDNIIPYWRTYMEVGFVRDESSSKTMRSRGASL
jgi:hypothetical protein